MLFHGDCEYYHDYLIVNESDIEPVKMFVKNTLLLYMKDHHVNKLQYELILNQIKVKDDPDTLWKILIALSNYTYHLTHHSSDHFSSLLHGIFSYDWKCEFKVSVAVIHLINQIVSTNATFLSRAFNLYIHSLLPTIASTIASSSEDSNARILLLQQRKLIHKAIKSIIDQVPTGRSVLFPILSDFFPHKRFNCIVQTEYVEQLLHICKYEPTLQYRILELIIKKCLEMDVEIAIDDTGDALIDTQDIDIEDDDDNEDPLFQFDCTMDHTPNKAIRATTITTTNNKNRSIQLGSSGIVGVRSHHTSTSKQLTDHSAVSAVSRIPPEVAELADKLDSLLILVIGFCKDEIYTSNSDDRLFQQLLSIFETAILSIHKSKFVQFCIFYVASLNISFAHSISERLLSIVIGQENNNNNNNNNNTQKQKQSILGVVGSSSISNSSNIHKQSAVMYLSSYLSRAMFLSIDYVNDTVTRLLVWASNYAKCSLSSSNKKIQSVVDFDEYGRIITTNNLDNNSISKHELFYSVVQSICYILCFYGVEIAIKQCKHPDTIQHWESIVLCSYDPLKYCLKSVRMEFLKLASCTELLKDECCRRLPQEWFYSSEQLGRYQYSDVETLYLKEQPINTNEDIKKSFPTTTTLATTDNTTIATTGTSSNSLALAPPINPSHNKHNNISLYPLEEAKHSSNIVNKLDSFFPFDPCLLYKVHEVIQDSYRVWEGGVPGLEELMNNFYDASSADIDDCDDDEEDDEDDEYGSSVPDDDQGTDSEYMNVSITDHRIPKNSSSAKEKRKKKSMDVNIFATSSLSSVVTSIAGTDLGASVNNSILMNTSTSNQMLLLDKSILPEEPSDDEDDDDDVHGEHMPIPMSNNNLTILNSNNLQEQGSGIPNSNNNEDMHRYTGIRRPRFYSIGSTGSW